MHFPDPPVQTASAGWDRYFQVNVDMAPILDTPGLPSIEHGESLALAPGNLVQSSERGFFLVAEEPLDCDPVEVGRALAGEKEGAGFASWGGVSRGRVRHTSTGTHVEVEQLIRGARLIGSAIRVHQSEEGIFAVTGRPLGEVGGRDPGRAPTFDEATALSTCSERFEIESGLRAAFVDQVVFPLDEDGVWAYEVGFVVPEHAADVRVFLKADDLSVLLSYNIAASGPGTAHVYPINPMRTPKLEEVTFDDLHDPGNLLRGAAIDVHQGDGVRLDSPNGDFHAGPKTPAFDEAQVYFHLQRIHEYFGGIVDSGLLQEEPFVPMVALVNDPESPGNAYYSPTTGGLQFGLFGPRSSARSASVVYHEFGHAVTDAICQLCRAPAQDTESRGLSEGFSDYFAAAALDSPVLGDYVADDENGMRNCSDESLRFPASYEGEEHATGAVWAALLWSMRQSMEPEDADRLAVESVYFLSPSSSFDDARAALQSADQKLNNGANKDLVEEVYAARAPE